MKKQILTTWSNFKAVQIDKKGLNQVKGGTEDTNGDGIITEEDIIT